MNATYVTIMLMSSMTPHEPYYYSYDLYSSAWECSEALAERQDRFYENNMMAQCLRTNVPTSTSTPIPRPDNLTEAYD